MLTREHAVQHRRSAMGRFIYLAGLALCGLLIMPGLLSLPVHASVAQQTNQALVNGTLIRDDTTGRVYLVWGQRRHWIDSPATMNLLYPTTPAVQEYSAAQVAAIPEGNALHLNTVANGLVWPLAPIRADAVQISLDQAGVVPGGVLRFSASGFQPGEPVSVDIPASGIQQVTADGQGAFSYAVTIPTNAGNGVHHIFAQGLRSGLLGAQVFYGISAAPGATVSATPSQVVRNSTLSVVGTGFAPGEQVQLFLNGGVSAATAVASGSGGFGPVALYVPGNLANGSYTLLAYGSSSARSTSTQVSVTDVAQPSPTPSPVFTPIPTWTAIPTPTAVFTPIPTPAPLPVPIAAFVNPTTISPGGRVVISGSGFLPGEIVLVRFNGALQNGVQANGSGSISGVLVDVPSGIGSGVYTISLTGATSGRSAGAQLSVQAPQPVPVASIAISPLNATPGSQISVAGTGFDPGESVLITLNGALMQSITTDAGGSFVSGRFVIPSNAGPGRYGVTATGATSGRTATTVLTVTAPPPVIVARLFINPSTIAPGGRVSVNGTGFAAGEPVVVRFDTTVLLGLNADANGSFSVAVTVNSNLGGHTMTATGASSGRSASAALQILRPVIAGIGLAPNRGHRGSLIRVNGNNFFPGEQVLIRFRNDLVQAAQADGAGRFANVGFSIPGNAPYGVSLVTISGARSGRSARAQLLVESASQPGPRISVSATKLHHGSTVSVSGSGFQGGEIVLIRYRGALVQAAQSNSHGSFSRATFRIPLNSPFGVFHIAITGARSGRSAAVIVSVSPVLGAGIAVSATVVKHNGTLTVSGHGFAAGEIVLIRLNGMLLAAPTADRHGNFNHSSFRVPSSIHKGSATLVALGARSGRHAQVTVVIF